ncbi:MAG: hypothetical protein ACRC46_06425 [Thermoguttaceae bacterium]
MSTTTLRTRLLEAAIVLTLLTLAISVANAATCETENFVVVDAPTPAMAQEIAETAERCRTELAVYWLGANVPRWREVCPIRVKVGDDLAPGGETSFVFQNGNVAGWEMKLQGSLVRLCDSVIPHEITHTLLAMHFRRPLPRWFDEGAATCMEHDSEKANYNRMLRDFLSKHVRRGLPFNRMVSMMQYPSDVMPLYAQGFSVAEFLLENGSPADYVRFGEQALASGDWSRAAHEVYGVRDLGELQLRWTDWVTTRLSPTPNNTAPVFPTVVATTGENDSVYARLMEDPRTLQPMTTDGPHRVNVLR